MKQTVMEQARGLHRTLRLLKNHLVRRHRDSLTGLNGERDCLDLTFPQLNTLMVVRDHVQLTIKELAEATYVSAPSASAMVDRLVEMGMLVREHSQVDRREVLVRLSPEGQTTAGRLEEAFLGCIVDLMERIGPEWTRKWCEVYTRIQEELEPEEPRLPVDGGRNPRLSEVL